MQTRPTATSCWQEDNGDDFEPDCAATVEDGFERGAAFHGLWLSVRSQEASGAGA